MFIEKIGIVVVCFLFVIISVLMPSVSYGALCEVALRVGDESGRAMTNLHVEILDHTCYRDFELPHNCIEVTDDDGIARFSMERFDVPLDTSEEMDVVVDSNNINARVNTRIACGDGNEVLLSNVFRSGRGRIVVRAPLNDGGCGNVLLVHGMKVSFGERCGYNGGENTWCSAASLFEALGYGVAEFQYPTGGKVQTAATMLGAALGRVALRTGTEEWYVVAHSFGGLVARECLNGKHALCAGRMQSLITLGTPHLGLSRFCTLFTCKPRAQIVTGSAHLNELAGRSSLDNYVLTIAGTKRNGISCTAGETISDGVVTLASANPPEFSLDYGAMAVAIDHEELSCMTNDTHASFTAAADALAKKSGCGFACVERENRCGKTQGACCFDGVDNDCDGRTDGFDIDCLSVDPGEF